MISGFVPLFLQFCVGSDEPYKLDSRYRDNHVVDYLGTSEENRKRMCLPGDRVEHYWEGQVQFAALDLWGVITI